MSRNVQMLSECEADVAVATRNRTAPLGRKPFIALSTQASEPLHKQLLGLSTNSKQVTAANSGHYVMIDRPDAVITAIREVVAAARTGATLQK
jgi:pimeloyl-ACP methyl ester carboxylesterase